MPKKLIDALTDVVVRAAKPRACDYKLFDGRGLFLLVKASGGRHWRLKYRLAQHERLLALGEYPDVGLKAARAKAGEARELVRQRIDPVQAGREVRVRRENEAAATFDAVAAEWITKKAKRWTNGHAEQTRQSLRDYVSPKIGRRPVAALDAQEIVRVLAPLERAGKLETLRRVRQRIGAVLAFAVQTGRRADNPIRDTHGAFEAPAREHFASIRQTELPVFLRRLDAYQGHASTLAIVRMILWTACRTGEVRGARVEEFDLQRRTWTIPARRMKKRRPHVVTLPTQAVAMLGELDSFRADEGYAFPSPGKPDQQASENIVLQALDKMGYRGKLTGHGLRAAVATGLEEMGFPVEIVKAQLSHAKDNLTDAAYLRGVHLERRATMMQQWADALDGLQHRANVVPLKASRA
ncbi:MAG: tyrosine-type recombinase/integrase [Burkholderiaceae bacterium]|jgi:integrase|nr:tyrosine-type recombinase/integrase [Burkholderiaceae bacterium]MEB2352012.1 tyrosine-type recombinase/integrase [Burkholderiaceae bacterium]